jgi:putative membrane-bound dehydrogenase-like protein
MFRNPLMTGLSTLAFLIAISITTRVTAQDPQPELVASTEPRAPEAERAGFRLPPGFVAQLVASEPVIHKPMNLAFDTLGRLWVTSSLEYPFPAREGQPARDQVVILEDFGPDGRARKSTVFADGLNIPIGVLPITPRQALVHSIPNIYLMTDDDGDGRADRREVAYGTIGYRDTHGMAASFVWGDDGWVYGTHGFANDSKLAGRDGQAITLNSGNTYRMRPDGQHI